MNIIEKKHKKDISDIYHSLSAEAQQSLMDFAEFLSQRDGNMPAEKLQKLDISRPADESVVAALKRLNLCYPMIERKLVFHEASSLMTEHIMQGRDATEVIDELEQLFENHYQEYLQTFEQDS